MTSYVLDYFATLGRKGGSLSLRANTNDAYPPAVQWTEAITDITVFFPGFISYYIFIYTYMIVDWLINGYR
jgi:hypothetical protein